MRGTTCNDCAANGAVIGIGSVGIYIALMPKCRRRFSYIAARIARLSPSPPGTPVLRRDRSITCMSSLVWDATRSASVFARSSVEISMVDGVIGRRRRGLVDGIIVAFPVHEHRDRNLDQRDHHQHRDHEADPMMNLITPIYSSLPGSAVSVAHQIWETITDELVMPAFKSTKRVYDLIHGSPTCFSP
jgi:hypothetical protein